MTRISDKFKVLSLRQRFLVAPVLGLLLLGLLMAVFVYEADRQDALLVRVANRDLAAFDRYFGVFIDLSAQHIALYDLLTNTRKLDEETVYDEAKKRLYAIHGAIQKLQEMLPVPDDFDRQGYENIMALRDEILRLTRAYREAVISAVELATVNVTQAPSHIARANDRFVAMNRAFARLLELQQKALASEIAGRIAYSRKETAVFASIGIFLAALLLALSVMLSRLLSRSLEAQIGVLAQLAGRTGADMNTAGANEIERIGQAIAAFRHTQLELKESEEHYRQVVELSPDPIFIESEGRIAFVNIACMKLFGANDAEALLGKPAIELTHPDHRELVNEYGSQIEKTRHPTPLFETKVVRLDGTIVDVEASGGPFVYRGNLGTQVVMRDITERKKAAERLSYLAQYDSLTALPNRSLFRDRLALAMTRSKRDERMLAVMFLGLDHFKAINDTLGHAAGDEVLKAVAALLSDSLRGVDTIARFGGDEFTIILENVAQVDQISTVAEKIKKIFSTPILIREREVFVTASIGITIYPLSGDEIDALLQMADVAMYHAKKMGRNSYEFYAPELNARAAERLQMHGLLRHALERQEFVLHYQPKTDAKSGRMVDMEALIRWDSKELGLVSPGRFIPLLEDTGMILEAGSWAIRQALKDHHEWEAQGLQPPRIAVNVSQVQLRQSNFVDIVRNAIKDVADGAHGLDLEITESLIMEDIEGNIEKLRAIRNMGINIAIDDFGTGYSSLGILAKLPVNALKIDRSFIITMASNPDNMTIVSTIISLAHALSLKVIAEGVETEEQSKILRLLRCDEMQGYLFSRPVPAGNIAVMLAQRRQDG